MVDPPGPMYSSLPLARLRVKTHSLTPRMCQPLKAPAKQATQSAATWPQSTREGNFSDWKWSRDNRTTSNCFLLEEAFVWSL
eukprot:90604-Prorocentrum_lima.AAC.1